MAGYISLVAVLVLAVLVQDAVCRERIYYGVEAPVYDWLGFIRFFLDEDTRAVHHVGQCAGTLIKPNVVLTAGHCVWDAKKDELRDASIFEVFFGSTEAGKGDKYLVKEVILHPDYAKPQSFDNDMSLLILEESVPDTDLMQLADTVSPNKYDGQELLAVGWGTTETGHTSKVLLEANITMYGDSTCHAYHGKRGTGKICSGAKGKETKTGPGDSGGPIMYWEDGKLREAGLVSFGVTKPHNPDHGEQTRWTAFTDVAYYHDWIMENSQTE